MPFFFVLVFLNNGLATATLPISPRLLQKVAMETLNGLVKSVNFIQEKEKLYQRGFCIEQGFIPPRGDIQHLHVTFTWCDDNVQHQVTNQTHEHIYETH